MNKKSVIIFVVCVLILASVSIVSYLIYSRSTDDEEREVEITSEELNCVDNIENNISGAWSYEGFDPDFNYDRELSLGSEYDFRYQIYDKESGERVLYENLTGIWEFIPEGNLLQLKFDDLGETIMNELTPAEEEDLAVGIHDYDIDAKTIVLEMGYAEMDSDECIGDRYFVDMFGDLLYKGS